MKFIVGKKIGMSQIFNKDGNVIPVTLIDAGPIIAVQVKTSSKDGYKACQFGFGKRNKINKAIQGHFKKLGNFRYVVEYRLSGNKDSGQEKISVGDKFDVSVFELGDKVMVSGISKGRGFQGVVKRYGHRGGPASHGHKHVLRTVGSVGCRFPQRVFKGKKMPGRMGFGKVTVKNLKIVYIDKKNGLLGVKGAVPGPINGFVKIIG